MISKSDAINLADDFDEYAEPVESAGADLAAARNPSCADSSDARDASDTSLVSRATALSRRRACACTCSHGVFCGGCAIGAAALEHAAKRKSEIQATAVRIILVTRKSISSRGN